MLCTMMVRGVNVVGEVGAAGHGSDLVRDLLRGLEIGLQEALQFFVQLARLPHYCGLLLLGQRPLCRKLWGGQRGCGK